MPWIDRVIDCMDMPLDENSFAGIICLDLLHHVSQPHTFLSEAARVLRRGTYISHRTLHNATFPFRLQTPAPRGY